MKTGKRTSARGLGKQKIKIIVSHNVCAGQVCLLCWVYASTQLRNSLLLTLMTHDGGAGERNIILYSQGFFSQNKYSLFTVHLILIDYDFIPKCKRL